jgi:hypothetical protein
MFNGHRDPSATPNGPDLNRPRDAFPPSPVRGPRFPLCWDPSQPYPDPAAQPSPVNHRPDASHLSVTCNRTCNSQPPPKLRPIPRLRNHVRRLSLENSDLRRELRDMIRVCRLLLDRRAHDRRLATSTTVATESPSSPERAAADAVGKRGEVRQAWQADTTGTDAEQQRRHDGEHSGGGGGAPAAQPVAGATAGGGVRGSSYGARSSPYGLSSVSTFAAGIDGLTDQNLAYVVAAARAQAEVDADRNRQQVAAAAAARRDAARAATAAAGRGGAALSGAAWAPAGGSGQYVREVAAQASMVGREVDRERRQVGGVGGQRGMGCWV